jgi:hypothetical protein
MYKLCISFVRVQECVKIIFCRIRSFQWAYGNLTAPGAKWAWFGVPETVLAPDFDPEGNPPSCKHVSGTNPTVSDPKDGPILNSKRVPPALYCYIAPEIEGQTTLSFRPSWRLQGGTTVAIAQTRPKSRQRVHGRSSWRSGEEFL